ncbi:hypothetical protein MIR68_008509 [Amoeboaphelidium protococcarum]|nr:hypothetical protein MIR68_008509 [Amoeboaphelidium protococcarum]
MIQQKANTRHQSKINGDKLHQNVATNSQMSKELHLQEKQRVVDEVNALRQILKLNQNQHRRTEYYGKLQHVLRTIQRCDDNDPLELVETKRVVEKAFVAINRHLLHSGIFLPFAVLVSGICARLWTELNEHMKVLLHQYSEMDASVQQLLIQEVFGSCAPTPSVNASNRQDSQVDHYSESQRIQKVVELRKVDDLLTQERDSRSQSVDYNNDKHYQKAEDDIQTPSFFDIKEVKPPPKKIKLDKTDVKVYKSSSSSANEIDDIFGDL